MEQNAALRALFSMIHFDKSFSSVQTLHLTNTVNYFLRRGEKRSLQPRKVGSVLKSLGLSNRKRTHLGWIVSLVSREECALCQAAAKRDPVMGPRKRGVLSRTTNMRDVLGYWKHTMNILNVEEQTAPNLKVTPKAFGIGAFPRFRTGKRWWGSL